MNYLSYVSLVIPSVVEDLGLVRTLVSRQSMDLFDQVVVVVSGVDAEIGQSLADSFTFNNESTNLSIVCVEDVLHPGQARNLGVKSVKTDYVSFLDARTLPSQVWFESLSDFVQNNQSGLKPGSVNIFPTVFSAELFISATFGFLPLSCLPGSISSVDTFSRVGNFISARSVKIQNDLRSSLIGVRYPLWPIPAT